MIPAAVRICRKAGASVVLLFPSIAFASPSSGSVAVSPVAGTLQMLLALGIVLAAIAGTAWLLRRMAPGQIGAAGSLRVVAAVAVGPKERVVLVDIGDTRMVLGVAAGQVTLLREMPRPHDADSSQGISPMSPFVAKLREFMAARRGGE